MNVSEAIRTKRAVRQFQNLPLPEGTDARTWFAAFDGARATIDRFGADALVVSLGLDTYVGAPLTTFRLSGDDFRRLGAKLKRFGLPVFHRSLRL